MNQASTNLLLTGPPGCGKTTVICRVIELVRDRRLAGFYTQEICRKGQRVGFEAVGLHGQSATLAHVDFHRAERVGRYSVDIGGFEAIVQQELGQADEVVDLFVIDEIGRMECLSQGFVEAVTRTLDSPVPLLATIAAKGGGFIVQVKARSDVEIVAVTAENRDWLANELADRIPA